MNRLGCVQFCLSFVVLFLIASFVLTASGQNAAPEVAQNASPASTTAAKKVKTRLSDRGFGQSLSTASACGPDSISLSVHLHKNPPPPAPLQPGKALVYFIHESGTPVELGYPTTLIGMDGAWAGANHGDSYFFINVDPGEHHVCAALQSSFVNQRVELAHFTAEAGTAYYFRTRLILSRSVELLELEPVDSDQGKYLAATFPLSESKPK
jgi:hypothetical protein